MVNLGDKVKDRVSGVTGIAVARTEWLHGCIRIVVQPQELKDGKPVDSTSFDEPSLEVVEAGVVPNDPFWRDPNVVDGVIDMRRTAGPQPDVSRAPDPTR